MKLKLNDDGVAVLVDGKPVYVHEDGKEVPFDAPAAMAKIAALNHEAKTYREAKSEAEARLALFDGIDDAAAAKRALATLKNLDDKKLIDAGEAERVKAEAIRVYEDKLAAAGAETDKIRAQFHAELIGGSFARSKVISERLAIPADVAQAFFGRFFGISDEGRIVAKDANGNEIYSRVQPGERADFDEALSVLVDAYPNKDAILKGSGSSGGGSGAGAGAVQSSFAACKTDDEKIAWLKNRA